MQGGDDPRSSRQDQALVPLDRRDRRHPDGEDPATDFPAAPAGHPTAPWQWNPRVKALSFQSPERCLSVTSDRSGSQRLAGSPAVLDGPDMREDNSLLFLQDMPPAAPRRGAGSLFSGDKQFDLFRAAAWKATRGSRETFHRCTRDTNTLPE